MSRNAEALQKELDPWIPRDIRRTVATNLGDLEIEDDQIRYLILGHSRGKLSETYNKAKYDGPKRQILAAWDTDLGRILRGEPREEKEAQQTGNVVEMRK